MRDFQKNYPANEKNGIGTYRYAQKFTKEEKREKERKEEGFCVFY